MRTNGTTPEPESELESGPLDPAFQDLLPVDLDLPACFTSWRPIQCEAISQTLFSGKRFNALAMPTGSGKSLTAMAISRLTGHRTVIVTGTKGLMDQYMREFGMDPLTSRVISRLSYSSSSSSPFRKPPPNELVDIRGKANYQCQEHPHLSCEDGQRALCKYWQTERCSYGYANVLSRRSQVVVTNYKYWMSIHHAGRGLSPQHLILDEAHLAMEELAGFLSFHISERETDELGFPCPDSEDLGDWQKWGSDTLPRLRSDLTRQARANVKAQLEGKLHKSDLDHSKRLEGLLDRVERLRRIHPGPDLEWDWVCQEERTTRGGRRWGFEPVWPGLYSESALFQSVPHVTLISATLRPKTLSLLGIKSSDSDFREWPRTFPVSRSPVIHIPTVRMNYKTEHDPESMRQWVDRIDQIIESRLDRKGIIHTVSYTRQQHLFQHSRFSRLFIGNTSDPDPLSETASQAVTRFKSAAAPCILVSPSFSTGWDFPGDECEWCIISKIPFPPSQTKVMKARMERDPQYSSYLAMQDLVQSAGRGMRSADDRCETFIVDDSISWFLYHHRSLAPKWFAVRKSAQVPPAPKSIFEEEMARRPKRGPVPVASSIG